MSEFFAMGGYAAFVWPSYGLTALVLLANWFWVRQSQKATLERLRNGVVEPAEERKPTVRHVP